jgi:hypothetical protein
MEYGQQIGEWSQQGQQQQQREEELTKTTGGLT